MSRSMRVAQPGKGASQRWDSSERAVLRALSTPARIQGYLDNLKYNIEDITRSPRGVMQTGFAHCFDGALMAAAALEFHGEAPLLMDLRANHEDDDHILAIFKRKGHFGALGKSNYTGCRFRDPVFRSLRELVMSYFCVYFNLTGKKTLREYSALFDLRAVHDIDWRRSEADLDPIGKRIDRIRHYDLIPQALERELAKADKRLFAAETLGLDPRGAFKIPGAFKIKRPQQ